MKCPYRTCTIHEMEDDDVYMDEGRTCTTHEEFEECYGSECPFHAYIAGRCVCRKAEKETK